MARNRMQQFNFLLVTLSILMAVVVTSTAIIAIWSESQGLRSILKVTGSSGVILAACFLNRMVNIAFAPRLGRLFPNLCYGINLFTIYASVVLIQLTIWTSISGEFVWKSIGTLLVLLFASLLALAFSSISHSQTVQQQDRAD